MTDASAEAGMEAVYRSYVEAFNREDGAGVARLLAYPAMVEGGNSPPVIIGSRTREETGLAPANILRKARAARPPVSAWSRCGKVW